MLYAFYACLVILYIKLAVFNSQITDTCGGRQGGGSPGERLREAGEERAGGGSLQGAGSGRPR